MDAVEPDPFDVPQADLDRGQREVVEGPVFEGLRALGCDAPVPTPLKA
ncbi:MAG: hypothetical protein ABSA21_12735 [Candidatus Limnocylindrales bacterium]